MKYSNSRTFKNIRGSVRTLVVLLLVLPPVAAVGLPVDCLPGVEAPGALDVVFLDLGQGIS